MKLKFPPKTIEVFIPCVLTVPETVFISPSKAEIKEDFPDPTDPTTPTN